MLPEGDRDGVRDRSPSRAGLPSLYASLAGKASAHLVHVGGPAEGPGVVPGLP